MTKNVGNQLTPGLLLPKTPPLTEWSLLDRIANPKVTRPGKKYLQVTVVHPADAPPILCRSLILSGIITVLQMVLPQVVLISRFLKSRHTPLSQTHPYTQLRSIIEIFKLLLSICMHRWGWCLEFHPHWAYSHYSYSNSYRDNISYRDFRKTYGPDLWPDKQQLQVSTLMVFRISKNNY